VQVLSDTEKDLLNALNAYDVDYLDFKRVVGMWVAKRSDDYTVATFPEEIFTLDRSKRHRLVNLLNNVSYIIKDKITETELD
jgi:hypothetical protein